MASIGKASLKRTRRATQRKQFFFEKKNQKTFTHLGENNGANTTLAPP
jgi:hypothetical protein